MSKCQVESCPREATYWLFNKVSPFKLMVCRMCGVFVTVYRNQALGDSMQMRIIKEGEDEQPS